VNQGASIVRGSALAETGAVTMGTNTVTACSSTSGGAIPEPGTAAPSLSLIGWKSCKQKIWTTMVEAEWPSPRSDSGMHEVAKRRPHELI